MSFRFEIPTTTDFFGDNIRSDKTLFLFLIILGTSDPLWLSVRLCPTKIRTIQKCTYRHALAFFQSMPSTLATTKLPLPVVEVEAGRRNANSFSFHRCIRFFNVFYRDAFTLLLILKLERGVFQCPSFQTFPTYQNLSRDGSFEWIVGPFF